MARRRLPKVLRFLGQRFEVELVAHLVHDNGDEDHPERIHRAYGVYAPAINTIYLDEGNGRNRQQVTLMHECLHATLDAAHATIPAEEDVVGLLAPLMVDFIRANHAAVAYTQEPQ